MNTGIDLQAQVEKLTAERDELKQRFHDTNKTLLDYLSMLLDAKSIMLDMGIEQDQFYPMFLKLVEKTKKPEPLHVEDIEKLEVLEMLSRRRAIAAGGKPEHHPDLEFYDGFVAAEKHYGIGS